MKYTHSFLILLVTALLSGCVATSVTKLSNHSYPPIEPTEVVLYLTEADIPGNFEKVAVMYSRADHSWTDENQMLKNVRKKAARMGANGVLIQRMKEPNTGDRVAQVLLGTEANRRGEMIAIYVFPKTDASSTSRRVKLVSE